MLLDSTTCVSGTAIDEHNWQGIGGRNWSGIALCLLLCLSYCAQEGLYFRIAHNRFPALGICEEVGIRLSWPAVRNKDDTFGHPFVHVGLHFYQTTVRFNDNGVPFFDSILTGRFNTHLCGSLRVLLL